MNNCFSEDQNRPVGKWAVIDRDRHWLCGLNCNLGSCKIFNILLTQVKIELRFMIRNSPKRQLSLTLHYCCKVKLPSDIHWCPLIWQQFKVLVSCLKKHLGHLRQCNPVAPLFPGNTAKEVTPLELLPISRHHYAAANLIAKKKCILHCSISFFGMPNIMY